MKFLIIHTFGIGDFILFTSIFEELCNIYPDATFDLFVTQGGATRPLVNHPRINDIYISPLSPSKLISTALKLRNNKYDISLTTSGTKVLKASLFAILVGAKIRIGEHRSGPSLFTHSSPYVPGQSRKFGSWKLASLLPEFNIEYEKLSGPTYSLTEEEKAFADEFITSHELDKKLILGIHPGSNGISKFRRWPMQYYAQLIEKIKASFSNLEVLLFIGPDEIEEGEYISSHASVQMIRDRSLGEIAALCAKCNVFFNSDSGLGHIASCFKNVHIASIFSTADERITGVDTPNRTIIKKGLPCQPCNPENLPKDFTCKFECLHDLSVDEVYNIIAPIIKKL